MQIFENLRIMQILINICSKVKLPFPPSCGIDTIYQRKQRKMLTKSNYIIQDKRRGSNYLFSETSMLQSISNIFLLKNKKCTLKALKKPLIIVMVPRPLLLGVHLQALTKCIGSNALIPRHRLKSRRASEASQIRSAVKNSRPLVPLCSRSFSTRVITSVRIKI